MKAFLTAQAHRDIAAIKSYIAQNNQNAANKIAKRLYGQANGLAESPLKGVALSAKFGIETDLRIWVVSPNIILYKIAGDKIIVTRVTDERRNYLAAIGLAQDIDSDNDE